MMPPEDIWMRKRMLMRSLARNERGNVLVLVGAGAMALVGGAGLGTDTIQWFMWKRQLQQAADAGAMAGAAAKVWSANADAQARIGVSNNSNTAVTIEAIRDPAATGAYAGNASSVEVILTTGARLPFSGMFMSAAPTIRARAVAARVSTRSSCVISLAPDGTGVLAAGNGVVGLGCGISANSLDAAAIAVQGASTRLTTTSLTASGNITVNTPENLPGSPTRTPFAPPQTDPFGAQGRNLQVPALTGGCLSIPNRNSYTLSPGRYCNGMELQNNATLSPGVYIIDGGDLKINAGAVVNGSGVTFIFTGNPATKIGGPSIQGGTVTLTPPTAEQNPTWADILFFQDSRATAGNVSKINGSSAINLSGALYFPKGEIELLGSSTQTINCLVLVAYRVKFSGTSNVANNCSTALKDQVALKMVRVVE
jgi:Flp pilus assembly protein TadG